MVLMISIEKIDYKGGRMELRNLITFIHVAEVGSFTKAAEELFEFLGAKDSLFWCIWKGFVQILYKERIHTCVLDKIRPKAFSGRMGRKIWGRTSDILRIHRKQTRIRLCIIHSVHNSERE